MKANKKTVWAEVKRYVIITLALFVMAFGWTAFLIPNHVLGGGVSGIATLIFYATIGSFLRYQDGVFHYRGIAVHVLIAALPHRADVAVSNGSRCDGSHETFC